MSIFADILGPNLATKDGGEKPTDEVLAGKTAVAIYFSAHWCPPCRGFTPELTKAYNEHLKAKGLEVVFVSSDKTEAEFDSYWGEQPWLAQPYAARDWKAKASKKFKVHGIPTLVILDGATGELITADGRESVGEDPTGESFPWKPKGFWETLGTDFLGKDGASVSVDTVKGASKVLGLYFSAHWCPPCRGFTPDLVKAYSEHLKGKGLEIIFCSSDRDQKSFDDYYASMPWLALPHGDERKAALSKMFGVRGIPAFVLVDTATGATISTNARGDVSGDPTGEEFPWHPKPLNDMTVKMGDINEELSLCVMMEGCDAKATANAVDVLTPIAEAAKAGSSTLYLYAPKTGGPTEQIRTLTQLGEPTEAPKLLLLDIPDNGGFYVSDATEVTADSVNAFMAAYTAGTLTRKQLGE